MIFRRFGLLVAVFCAVSLAVLAGLAGANGSHSANPGSVDKVILFASDGMRPDLMERLRGHGHMPTYRELCAKASRGQERPDAGLPAEHGRRLAHACHRDVARRARLDEQHVPPHRRCELQQPDVLRRDRARSRPTRSASPPSARARPSSRSNGLRRAQLRPGSPGPCGRLPHVLLAAAESCSTTTCRGSPPTRTVSASPTSGSTSIAATGWTNVPASFSPAKQEQLLVTNTPSLRPTTSTESTTSTSTTRRTTRPRTTTTCWSCRRTAGKDGSLAVANLAQRRLGRRQGHADRRTCGSDRRPLPEGRSTSRPTCTASASTSLSLAQCVNATLQRALAARAPLGFEESLNHDFPSSTAADFAPLEAHIIDEDTYVEQGLKWTDAHWAYLRYIFDDPRSRAPTCSSSATPVTDEFATSSWRSSRRRTSTGIRTRTSTTSRRRHAATTGSPFVRATSGRLPRGRQTLALGRELMGEDDTTVFASSDHGFAPQWYAVNGGKVLADAGLQTPSKTATAGSRSAPAEGEGLLGRRHGQVYINLVGRDPGGVVRRPPSTRRFAPRSSRRSRT